MRQAFDTKVSTKAKQSKAKQSKGKERKGKRGSWVDRAEQRLKESMHASLPLSCLCEHTCEGKGREGRRKGKEWEGKVVDGVLLSLTVEYGPHKHIGVCRFNHLAAEGARDLAPVLGGGSAHAQRMQSKERGRGREGKGKERKGSHTHARTHSPCRCNWGAAPTPSPWRWACKQRHTRWHRPSA